MHSDPNYTRNVTNVDFVKTSFDVLITKSRQTGSLQSTQEKQQNARIIF